MPEAIAREVVEDLIGTPYDTLDCFGVVRAVFQRSAGIALPSNPVEMGQLFGEVWWSETDGELDAVIAPCDVLVMATQRNGIGTHVGVVLDVSTFLHTRKKIGACLESVQHWKTRTIQVLRYRPGLPS